MTEGKIPEMGKKDGGKKPASNLPRRLVMAGLLALAHVPAPDRSKETAEERLHRAKIEMETLGITSEQKEAYKTGISEAIYKAVSPYGYEGNQNLKDLATNLKESIISPKERTRDIAQWPREDAWRLYLGLPQEFGTFAVSEYKPSYSIEDKYYYKMPDFFGHYLYFLMTKERLSKVEDAIKILVSIAKEKNADDARLNNSFDAWRDDWGPGMGVMGKFKFSLGEDKNGPYVSYYDKWDLDVFVEKNGGLLGKNFEIYDRIYFDPITFKPKEPVILVNFDGNQFSTFKEIPPPI